MMKDILVTKHIKDNPLDSDFNVKLKLEVGKAYRLTNYRGTFIFEGLLIDINDPITFKVLIDFNNYKYLGLKEWNIGINKLKTNYVVKEIDFVSLPE